MPETWRWVQSAIKELDKQYSWLPADLVGRLITELEFLNTFLIYIPNWAEVDEGVHQHLGDLLTKIEAAAAFAIAGLKNIADGSSKQQQTLNSLCIQLLKKTRSFKPEIRKAYHNLSDYSLQSKFPVTDPNIWVQYFRSIRGNVFYLASKEKLDALTTQMQSLKRILERFAFFIEFFNSCLQFTDLWTYYQSLALPTACLSYLCWIDGDDQKLVEKTAILVADLEQKTKLSNPVLTALCLKALNMVKGRQGTIDYLLSKYAEFLVPLEFADKNLREGLVFLLKISITDEIAENLAFISSDENAFVSLQVNDLVLFQLLQKMELLKVEAFLFEQLESIKENSAPADVSYESLKKGLTVLRMFYKHPQGQNYNKMELILTHIEALVADIGCLYHSFQANNCSESMIRNVLKLLENAKLLKASTFLTMAFDSKRCFRDHFKTPEEELKFFTMFLSEEKSQDVKLIVTHVESLVGQEKFLAYSASNRQITEDIVKELDDSLSILLEKIKIFILGEACNNYSNYSHSSIIDFNIWEDDVEDIQRNLQLLSCKVDMTIPLKGEIEALREKLKSLVHFIHYAMNWNNNPLESTDLDAYLRYVVACTHTLCAADKIDESMITYVVQKINPSSAQVFEMYVRVLRSLAKKYGTHYFLAGHLVKFLLPMNYAIETLREGLIFLIVYLISIPEEHTEDVEVISADIRSVIQEAGSINDSSHRGHEFALFQLLERIELLKAEAFVMKLIKNGMEAEAKFLFRAIEEGFKVLEKVLRHPPEQMKLILTHVGAVVADIGSFYHSLHANGIEKGRPRDGFKLLVNIKLLKAVVFLVELTHGQACHKDQIEILQQQLQFLRKLLSGLPNENSQDEKLILTHMEGVARMATSLYHSFYANHVTEDLPKGLESLLSNFLEKIQLVISEVKDIFLQVRKLSYSKFPQTNGLGFFDFFMQNLQLLLNYEADSIGSVKHLIESVQMELVSLRSFLRDTAKQGNEHNELKQLSTSIKNLVYEADYAIDSIVLQNGVVWYHILSLSDVIDQLKLIKAQVKEIHEEKKHDILLPNAADTSTDMRLQSISQRSGEVMVELKDQVDIMIDHLTRGSSHRGVVSIIGMPGLGKTTLAKNVFNNPSVQKTFHIRAWCYVSETFHKRDLLLKILSDITEFTDKIHNKSDEDLELLLYQSLKGYRYLVVMDDLWDIRAWHELESSFPDDENGSRILFTSRDEKVALAANSVPHDLRLLSDKESWMLLLELLFDKEGWPEELVEVGKLIAESCQGLPLAVVAMAGLLDKTDKKQETWMKFTENLSSLLIHNPQSRCREILEMSYNYLADELKACFLYFGAFLQVKEFPVWKIKRFWIAEGFVPEIKSKSLEEVADDYLMELISRSLVSVAQRRSIGGVKACRVHDLLRNLCLSKSKEENFFQRITGYDKLLPSYDILDYGVDSDDHCSSESITHDQHRISIFSKRKHFVMLKPSGPRVRSLLFSPTSDSNPTCPYDVSFISDNFKLLRVLDLEGINMGSSFPFGFELLLQLRYLAICGHIDSIPSSIAKLRFLETLLVKGLKGKVALPDSVWSMERLMHLHVNNVAIFQLQDKELKENLQLSSLVTLSSPFLKYGEETMKMLKRLPQLRKLRCIFSQSLDHSGNCNLFPILDFLDQLESLKIFYSGSVRQSCEFNFPKNLKKLTLSDFCLPWDCISAIGKLPNLEVLKLLSRAFRGQRWEMRDGEFCKLKFLKLDSLDIAQWSASEDHLPRLERLILRCCKKLVEIPPVLGEISTMQMIGVQWCNPSLEKLVKQIKEEQEDLTNTGFKVLINLPDADFRSSS